MILSVLCSLILGNGDNLSAAIVDSGAQTIQLLLTLAGVMTLWSGIMKIAEQKFGDLEGLAQQYLFYWKREA